MLCWKTSRLSSSCEPQKCCHWNLQLSFLAWGLWFALRFLTLLWSCFCHLKRLNGSQKQCRLIESLNQYKRRSRNFDLISLYKNTSISFSKYIRFDSLRNLCRTKHFIQFHRTIKKRRFTSIPHFLTQLDASHYTYNLLGRPCCKLMTKEKTSDKIFDRNIFQVYYCSLVIHNCLYTQIKQLIKLNDKIASLLPPFLVSNILYQPLEC